jgi:hypothetical protein
MVEGNLMDVNIARIIIPIALLHSITGQGSQSTAYDGTQSKSRLEFLRPS